MSDQISTINHSWLNWLSWQDEKQMKWAVNYFTKKGFVYLRIWSPEASSTSLKSWLEERPNNAETELLLARAQNAWRQQKHRKQKPGHKAYNFVLPTEVQTTLKQLARMQRTNMTEALKNLIGEALEAEKHHKRELRALLEKHKQAQERLTEKKNNAEQQIKTYAKSIADHTHATKVLAAEVKELLWHKVEHTLGITRAAASPDERTALDELQTEELEKLKHRLPLNSRFDAFSSRPSQRATPQRTIGSDSPAQPKTSTE